MIRRLQVLVCISMLDWLRWSGGAADYTNYLLKEEALSHLHRAGRGHRGMPSSWLRLPPPPKPADGSAVSLLIGQEWPSRSARDQEKLPAAFSSSYHGWQWGIPTDLSSFLLWTKRWRDMTLRKSSFHEHVSMHFSLSDTTAGKELASGLWAASWPSVIHPLPEDIHWENLFIYNIWGFVCLLVFHLKK